MRPRKKSWEAGDDEAGAIAAAAANPAERAAGSSKAPAAAQALLMRKGQVRRHPNRVAEVGPGGRLRCIVISLDSLRY
jgi:hypothetical protein